MAKLSDGRVETVHIQTGDFVYIFETDEILRNDDKLLGKVLGLKEVAGTAQGQGIETVWWDTSEIPVIESMDPYALKRAADFVRSLEQGAKEKPIVVKVKKERSNGNHKANQ